MRRLIPGIVTNACLIVASNGRMVPPTVPTFGPDLASDLGAFIGVFALLHGHQLALARADESALLRSDPAGPFRLDCRPAVKVAVDAHPRTAGRDGGEGDRC